MEPTSILILTLPVFFRSTNYIYPVQGSIIVIQAILYKFQCKECPMNGIRKNWYIIDSCITIKSYLGFKFKMNFPITVPTTQ